MKKILITGAGGTLGIPIIAHLLASEDYEITALDFKSSRSIKRLKKYKDRINIIYGDINEEKLIRALVKDHDYIIHLAGVIPPFADIKSELAKEVDYEGTKCLIRAINSVNPKCFLIFASSTTVYGEKEEISAKDEPVVDSDDNYAMIKLRCEEKIQEKLSNYTIFRLPAILGDPKTEAPMYNIPFKSHVEFITVSDAALAIVKATENKKDLNKKLFNISGGEDCRTTFKKYMIKMLQLYGISVRYIITSFLVDKNFYSGYYTDNMVAENLLSFQTESLDDYYRKIKKRYGSKRWLAKLFAKPVIFYLKRKK